MKLADRIEEFHKEAFERVMNDPDDAVLDEQMARRGLHWNLLTRKWEKRPAHTPQIGLPWYGFLRTGDIL